MWIEGSRCLEGGDHRRPYRRILAGPYASDSPRECPVFQDDNAPVHAARCVQRRLYEHDDEVEDLN